MVSGQVNPGEMVSEIKTHVSSSVVNQNPSFSSSDVLAQGVRPFSMSCQTNASHSTRSKAKCDLAVWTIRRHGGTASRSHSILRVCAPFWRFYRAFKRETIDEKPDDIHFPTLTVNQTLKFALRNKVPREREQHPEEKHEYVQHTKHGILDSLGIGHTVKTKVGNEFIRGVSGGERKRVSLAEMMAGHVSTQTPDLLLRNC